MPEQTCSGRKLTSIVHFILFSTASVGLAVSLAVLAEDRPWALDLEATERFLGLEHSGSTPSSLDRWIYSIESRDEGGQQLTRLLILLYRSWAYSVSFCSCFILLVSFFAPTNRPLVLSVQVLVCSALYSLERYSSQWHNDSRHRPTILWALVLNIIALMTNVVDFYLRRRQKEKIK